MNSIKNGIYVAAISPLNSTLDIDQDRLIEHCTWLLDKGASGILIMGTTGEANSFSIDERKSTIIAVLNSGIPVKKIMVGTGCCSYKDTIDLTNHALSLGIKHILMLPPFYYKNIDDEGLLNYFEKVIRYVDSKDWKLYLYHFPAMSGVFFNNSFIKRLIEKFPNQIAGMKDSGGDWSHMKNMRQIFPDIKTFAGNEKFLSDILDINGSGCISATINLSVSLAARLLSEKDHSKRSELQSRLNQLREVIEKYPIIPAIKHTAGIIHGDKSWDRLRPPLCHLTPEQLKNLTKDLNTIDFPEAYV
jgi:4-hydroxy-tetrahydrodipicolinate synthase